MSSHDEGEVDAVDVAGATKMELRGIVLRNVFIPRQRREAHSLLNLDRPSSADLHNMFRLMNLVYCVPALAMR